MAGLDMSEDELQHLLGKAIAARPWPILGNVVNVAMDWNGPEVTGSADALNLRAGDQVKVEEIRDDGLLYGVVKGPGGRAGWFGGSGCEAHYSVVVQVPIGPQSGDVPAPTGDTQRYEDRYDRAPEATAPAMEMDGDLGMEVEAYIERHGFDEASADKLRALTLDLQAEVIKSDLTNTRNPSAVLLSRIERVRAGGASGPPPKGKSKGGEKGGGKGSYSRHDRSRTPPRRGQYGSAADSGRGKGRGGGGLSADTEDFIHRLQLDEKCSEHLRAMSYDQQDIIVKTDLTNARNPSAVVFSRIKTVLGWESQRVAVEDYISRNRIDEDAAAALHACSSDVQQQVIEMDLSNARNTSAVLLSRIRQIEAGTRGGDRDRGAPSRDSSRMPGSYSRQSDSKGRGKGGSNSHAIEDYVRQHGLDDRVESELRGLSPGELQTVMDNPITNARNPSAIVKARITQVRKQSENMDPVDAYLQRYPVDEGAQRALRQLAPHLQDRIIEQEMSNCRNPSAVLLSRIRGLKDGTRQ
eukprot:TRINITY_DN93181_c0_g1_i1.p1 TRINITY_DN93181_c0_g1~~TRINITY_DN93181_c0_g1_i1.p1  ORF type:complete len:548 (-),score=104.68 TRINITY_DN93181_c0_g1_i1:73-1644(-)